MLTDPLTEAEQHPIPHSAIALLSQLASARLDSYGVGLDISDMTVVAVGIRRGQRIVHIDPIPARTHWRGMVAIGYSPLTLESQLAGVELMLDDDCQADIQLALMNHLAYTGELDITIHANACTIVATATNLLYRGKLRVPFRVRANRR